MSRAAVRRRPARSGRLANPNLEQELRTVVRATLGILRADVLHS